MPILKWFIENEPKHKSYNIVPDKYNELRDIANYVAEISGNKDVRVANDGYGLDYYGSNTLLRSEMKNVKFTPIKKAISELYNWYSQNKNLINKQMLIKDR